MQCFGANPGDFLRMQASHATLADRLAYIEQLMEDSFDKRAQAMKGKLSLADGNGRETYGNIVFILSLSCCIGELPLMTQAARVLEHDAQIRSCSQQAPRKQAKKLVSFIGLR